MKLLPTEIFEGKKISLSAAQTLWAKLNIGIEIYVIFKFYESGFKKTVRH